MSFTTSNSYISKLYFELISHLTDRILGVGVVSKLVSCVCILSCLSVEDVNFSGSRLKEGPTIQNIIGIYRTHTANGSFRDCLVALQELRNDSIAFTFDMLNIVSVILNGFPHAPIFSKPPCILSDLLFSTRGESSDFNQGLKRQGLHLNQNSIFFQLLFINLFVIFKNEKGTSHLKSGIADVVSVFSCVCNLCFSPAFILVHVKKQGFVPCQSH